MGRLHPHQSADLSSGEKEAHHTLHLSWIWSSLIKSPKPLFLSFFLPSSTWTAFCVCVCERSLQINWAGKKRKLIQSKWPCNQARRGPPASFHSSRAALTLSFEQQSEWMNKIWKNNTLIYLNCTIIWQIWEVLHKHFHQNNLCLVSFQSASQTISEWRA